MTPVKGLFDPHVDNHWSRGRARLCGPVPFSAPSQKAFFPQQLICEWSFSDCLVVVLEPMSASQASFGVRGEANFTGVHMPCPDSPVNSPRGRQWWRMGGSSWLHSHMWKEVGSQGRSSEERKHLCCRSTGCQGDRVEHGQQPLWLEEQPSKAWCVRGRCPCYPLSFGWHWMSEVALSLDVIKASQLWSIALWWRMQLLPWDRPLYREHRCGLCCYVCLQSLLTCEM